MFPYTPDDLCPVLLPSFCDGETHLCSASNAAEDQLAELSRLVGSGTTLGSAGASQSFHDDLAILDRPVAPARPASPPAPVEAVTPQIEMVDHAPPLQFDLEMELQRAFNGDPAAAPAPAEKPATLPFASIAAAAAPSVARAVADPAQVTPATTAKPKVVSVVAVKHEAPKSTEPEADFSDLIAEELDRALQEEIASEGLGAETAAAAAPSLMTDPVLEAGGGFSAAPVAPRAEAPAKAPMPRMAPEPDFNDAYSDLVADTSDPVAEFDTMVADAQAPIYHEEELRVPQVPFEPKPANRGGRKAALVLLGVAMLGATAALGVSLFSGGGSNQGEVPVLMAEKDPVKVKPEDAGGSVVPNQDQAVYESVEGKAVEAPKQAELRDTTETPIAVQTTRVIEQNDGAPKAADRILTPKRVRTTVVRPDGSIVTDGPQETASAPLTAPIVAPTQPTGAYTAPTADPATPAAPAAPVAKLAPTPVKIAPVKVTAVPVTPEPVPAPKVEEPAPVAAAPAPESKPAPAPEPVTTASTAPFAVQISSQRSQAAAQQSYADISRRYASIVGGKGVDIRKAVVKGRDYYRVRIPAQSRSEANAMCSSLKSAGGDCFVTR